MLSYFDTRVGPKVFLKAPENFKDEKLERITQFLDLDTEAFFIHEFDKIKSINYKFEIPSKRARGNVESLMVSIILIEEELQTDFLREILEQFIKDFKEIKAVAKVFNALDPKQLVTTEKYLKVQKFFIHFYEFLPKQTNFTKKRKASVFIFGLDFAGKTTIINRLKENVFTDPKPTTNINIVRLLFENLSITAYDAGGQKQYRKIWKSYLKNQDALVFTLDIADPKRYEEARQELHRIANLPELRGLPLLILFNKVDLKKPNVDSLMKEMKLNQIKNHRINHFYTSALTNEGINEAFNWLATEILNSLVFS